MTILLDPREIVQRKDGGSEAAKRMIGRHLAPNRRADSRAKEKNDEVGKRNQPQMDLRDMIRKRKREREGGEGREGEGETKGKKRGARGVVGGGGESSKVYNFYNCSNMTFNT